MYLIYNINNNCAKVNTEKNTWIDQKLDFFELVGAGSKFLINKTPLSYNYWFLFLCSVLI